MYFGKYYYIINDYYLELHPIACFLPATIPPAWCTFPTLSLVEFVNMCHNLERLCVCSLHWYQRVDWGEGIQAHLIN